MNKLTAEAELAQILTKEILLEIDREIFQKVYRDMIEIGLIEPDLSWLF